VYNHKIGDRELTFGVSGRLYQSSVLLYDKETEILCSVRTRYYRADCK